MNAIPSTVTSYINSICYKESEFAFILLDFSNALIEYGGVGAQHVLLDLDKLEPVVCQLPVLVGLLPCTNNPVILSRVQMSPEQYTEIHLFANEIGQWLIFIDTTIESHQAQCEQQIRLSSELNNEYS